MFFDLTKDLCLKKGNRVYFFFFIANAAKLIAAITRIVIMMYSRVLFACAVSGAAVDVVVEVCVGVAVGVVVG